MADFLVLINPFAGVGLAKNIYPVIIDILKKNGYRKDKDYIVQISTPEYGYKEIKALPDSIRKIIVVAGDGTIRQVVDGIVKSKKENDIFLGVVAVGTGNDFARASGSFLFNRGNPKRNLEPLLINLLNADVKNYDVWILNDLYCFVNYFSFGIDAKIVNLYHKLRQIPQYRKLEIIPSVDVFAYFFTSLTAINYRCSPEISVHIKSGNEWNYLNFKKSCPSIILSNLKTYAGGGSIYNKADSSDGIIELTLVSNLISFTSLVLSRYTKFRFNFPPFKIYQWSGSEIILKNLKEKFLQLDGDDFSDKLSSFNEFHIKRKCQIKVLSPIFKDNL